MSQNVPNVSGWFWHGWFWGGGGFGVVSRIGIVEVSGHWYPLGHFKQSVTTALGWNVPSGQGNCLDDLTI